MQRSRPLAARNRIDLADPSQTRSLIKRLGISAGELERIVAKVGNSITAVTKEIQRKTPAVREALEVQQSLTVQSDAPRKVEVAA